MKQKGKVMTQTKRRPELHVQTASDSMAVREALAQITEDLSALDLCMDVKITFELVLAEVLNNVVEHAYGGDGSGVIEIVVSCEEDGLHLRVKDRGKPMPRGVTSAPNLADLDVPTQELPEGGFGWHLISSLAKDLDYHREGAVNNLSMRIGLGV